MVLVLKNTSAGLDNISLFHLKLIAPDIYETRYIITNHVLKCGIFPISLRKAKIVSVSKEGDKREVFNYRPISIFSSITKVV